MIGAKDSVDASFPDPREFDITKCCRMFANCSTKTPADGLVLGNMNVWIPATGGSGNIQLVSDYDDSSSQRYNFNIPIGGLRVGLSDRVAAKNSNLMAGQFEMDCTARVRWIKQTGQDAGGQTAEDPTVPRIGFSQGHVTYFPLGSAIPNPFNSCIAFTNYGAERTWFAHLSVNGGYFDGVQTVANGPIFYETRVDTGVPINEWNTLHVWVDRRGRQVKFYANGRLVYEENDPARIPRRDNYVGALNLNEEINVTSIGDTVNNGGFTIRGTQVLVSGTQPFQMDWIRVRYFPKR